MKYVIFILCISLVKALTFPTSFGDCTLTIYDGKIEQSPELVNHIQYQTEDMVRKWGVIIKKPFSIYITENKLEFHKHTKTKTPEWGIAVAMMNPDRIILKSPGIANISYNRIKDIITHELCHVFMFRINNYYSIPSWFKEGVAMQIANEFSFHYKFKISFFLFLNRILPLSKLHNFKTLPNNDVKMAYGISGAAVEALNHYYKKTIISDILKNLDNYNFSESFYKSTGDRIIDFQLKLDSYLYNNYNWLFLIRSNKYIYILCPIILLIGFILNYKRKKYILNKWEKEELEELDI